MNKIIKITITFLLFSVLLQAQNTNITYFNKVYGGNDTMNMLTQIVKPLDEGYIIMGGYRTPNYCFLYAAKLDVQGNMQWFKNIDSINTNVTSSYDLGILESGSTVTQIDNQTFMIVYHKYHDVGITKIDTNGTVAWRHVFEKEHYQIPKQIIKTIDGGFAIAGVTANAAQDSTWGYLLKLNYLGQFEWDRLYNRSNSVTLFSVQQWWDGTYIMGGWGWNGTDYDMWVVKTAANGDTLWTKALGGGYNDCAASVSFLTTWEDWYFNNAPVTYLVEGCYYVEVTFPIEQVVSKQYVAKLTEDGNTLLWEHKYLNPDLFLLSSLQTMPIIYPDGSFLGVAGYYNQDFPDEGFYAAVLMKFRSNGTVEWYKKFYPENTFAEAYLKDLQRTPDGGYVMAGYQYNPSPQKGWVLKLDEEFNTCSFVGCDSTIYTGYPIGLEEVLLNKAAFSIIPNPTNNYFDVYLSNESIPNQQLSIYDINGRLLQTTAINGQHTLVNVAHLPSGMYYCKLSNDSSVQKLVIIK